MSLGGPVLRQHVVEFSRAGVTTNGVLNATGNPGPYNWTPPDGVVEIFVDGCGAGSSGGAGAYQAAALSAGGGAGGKGGICVRRLQLTCTPGVALSITLGAGGTGSASGDGAFTAGGDTTIANLPGQMYAVSGTLRLKGGAQAAWLGSAPTSATTAIATRGQGQGADGTDGGINQAAMQGSNLVVSPVSWTVAIDSGSNGGGGKASAAAGGNGGMWWQTYAAPFNEYGQQSSWQTVSTGTTSGGGSWGAGGRGSPSLFSGNPPAGGNGDVVGTSASSTDYGAGGGGGGGSGTARRAGGNGGDGYVRFTYWAAD